MPSFFFTFWFSALVYTSALDRWKVYGAVLACFRRQRAAKLQPGRNCNLLSSFCRKWFSDIRYVCADLDTFVVEYGSHGTLDVSGDFFITGFNSCDPAPMSQDPSLSLVETATTGVPLSVTMIPFLEELQILQVKEQQQIIFITLGNFTFKPSCAPTSASAPFLFLVSTRRVLIPCIGCLSDLNFLLTCSRDLYWSRWRRKIIRVLDRHRKCYRAMVLNPQDERRRAYLLVLAKNHGALGFGKYVAGCWYLRFPWLCLACKE